MAGPAMNDDDTETNRGTARRRMGVVLFFLLGVALTVALVVWSGAGDLAALFARLGWGEGILALLVVVAVFSAIQLVDAIGWGRLIPATERPGWARLFWLRYVCNSVNTLLPVAQVGGEFVRALGLARLGLPAPRAGAGVVIDLTLGLATLVIFALLGLALAGTRAGGGDTLLGAAIATAVFAALIAGFVAAQRRGLFAAMAHGLGRFTVGQRWLAVVGGATALDAEIDAIYRRRGPVLSCAAWRLVGWLAGAFEVWAILWFLGIEVGFAEALILESLGQIIRNAGFAIPGALGVQEGGFTAIALLLGLGPEVGLAVSLFKRARVVVVGLPILLVWQALEGRRLAARS